MKQLTWIVVGWLACPAFAFAESPDNSWFIGAGAGASYPIVSHRMNVRTGTGGVPSGNSTSDSAETSPQLSLYGGYMLATCMPALPFYSFGLNYTNAFSFMTTGLARQNSVPAEFFNYRFRIQRQSLLGFFKTNFIGWRQFLPFINLATGVSVNTADHYSEVPANAMSSRVSPGFKGKTKAYFSYGGGVGIDFVMPPQLRFSLEYDYGYFGYAQTDNSRAGQRLKTKLTANAVMFNVFYYFEEMA